MAKTYEKNETIFEEGEPSDYLFTIASGRVKVVKLLPSGKEVILEFLPSRVPPLLYFAFAHACLAAAFAATAVDPHGIGGFFYHPRMLAVVHLVTLGWISGSVLGSIYLLGPLALRFPLPARRLDHAAFGSFAVGVTGMASHFWIDRPPGMAWSAALVTLALAWVSVRVLSGLRRAAVPPEVKLPVAFAFANALLAAGLGLLLAVNKVGPFLPFAQLAGALGHAHLAVPRRNFQSPTWAFCTSCRAWPTWRSPPASGSRC